MGGYRASDDGYATYRKGSHSGEGTRGHKRGKRSYRCRFCGVNSKKLGEMLTHIAHWHRSERKGEWTT